MNSPNFALIRVLLLLGAICSCATAYYFPNGPPNRPPRQAASPSNSSIVTFKPEPRELQFKQHGPNQDIPKPPAVPNSDNDSSNSSGDVLLTMEYVTIKPEPRKNLKDDDPPPKPEPRSLPDPQLEMIPQRKDPSKFGRQRQSSRCQQSYTFAQPGESATLQSPNYPRQYPNNVQSSNCFSSPSGTTMTVVCDEFNVENSRSCNYDYLGIALSGNPNSIQKYCGRGRLRSPSTSGNSLVIVFKSDYSNPSSSSRNPYRFSCRVTVSGSSEGGGANTTTTVAPTPPTSSGNCTCGRRNDGSRIVGGTNAKVNEFPWRCYLKTDKYAFFCGCSILSNNWILTAAHCTAAVMPLRGDTLYVVVGGHDRSSTPDGASQQIAVEKVHDHSGYNDETMDNDVSLLKLSRSLTFSNAISPVCLPFNYANDEFSGTNVTASGWGTTSQGGSTSNILKEVNLPVLTTAQCSQYYPGQITERMICTYSPGKDTCQGDSGGSIDLSRNGRYYHIGVVSWGIGCARQNNPGVYAKTTKFLNWITATSGESFCRA